MSGNTDFRSENMLFPRALDVTNHQQPGPLTAFVRPLDDKSILDTDHSIVSHLDPVSNKSKLRMTSENVGPVKE